MKATKRKCNGDGSYCILYGWKFMAREAREQSRT